MESVLDRSCTLVRVDITSAEDVDSRHCPISFPKRVNNKAKHFMLSFDQTFVNILCLVLGMSQALRGLGFEKDAQVI